MRSFLATLLLVNLLISSSPPTHSQECDGQTCIDVSAGNKGDLVITVKKGKSGSTSTKSPAPTPPKPRATPTITYTQKPTPPSHQGGRREPQLTPKPTPKPKVSKSPGISLMEEVRKMLPSGILITQPYSAFLVREPVNFMTTIPQRFETVIVVLDIPIQITLTATYQWDFGDGETLETKSQGAPYPIGNIRHSYSESGAKNLKLTVNWSGTWRSGSISGPIKGSMKADFERVLMIRTADTRLNQ